MQVLTRLHSIVCKVHSQTALAHNLCSKLHLGLGRLLSACKLHKPIALAEASVHTAHYEAPQDMAMRLEQSLEIFRRVCV